MQADALYVTYVVSKYLKPIVSQLVHWPPYCICHAAVIATLSRLYDESESIGCCWTTSCCSGAEAPQEASRALASSKLLTTCTFSKPSAAVGTCDARVSDTVREPCTLNSPAYPGPQHSPGPTRLSSFPPIEHGNLPQSLYLKDVQRATCLSPPKGSPTWKV